MVNLLPQPPARLDHGVKVVGADTQTGVVSPPFADCDCTIVEAIQSISTTTIPLEVVVRVRESHLQPFRIKKVSISGPFAPHVFEYRELAIESPLSIVPVNVPVALPFSVP